MRPSSSVLESQLPWGLNSPHRALSDGCSQGNWQENSSPGPFSPDK